MVGGHRLGCWLGVGPYRQRTLQVACSNSAPRFGIGSKGRMRPIPDLPTELRMFPLELIVLLILPAIYVAGSAFFVREMISRPWLFIVLSLCAMYLLYIAVFFLLPVNPQGYVLEATANARGETEIITKSTDGRAEPSLLRSFLGQIAAFSLLAFPSLWLMIRLFRR